MLRFTERWKAGSRPSTHVPGSFCGSSKPGSGIIGQPITYRGPDGKQYVAILSGIGGWPGSIVCGDLDTDDETAGEWLGQRASRTFRTLRQKEERCMFSRFPSRCACCCAALAFAVGLCRPAATSPVWEKHYIEPPKQKSIPASETALRVCADPNNLPFSNDKRRRL